MYRCVIMDADAKRHGHGNCNLEDDLFVVVDREMISRIGTHSIVVVTLLLRFIDLCCVLVIIIDFPKELIILCSSILLLLTPDIDAVYVFIQLLRLPPRYYSL